jgi:tetratricopeptide (TPR) repeat protein
MRIKIGSWLTLVACLFLAQPIYAQSKEDLAKAKELVTKADGLFKTNDVEKALELYKEAYILSNRAEVQFNMGQCYRALKDHENAIKSYKRFLAEYKKQSSLVEKAKTLLKESEVALEQQKAEELAQRQREEAERKRREEEERARQAAIEEAARKEEERLAEERRLALLAAQDKPFEKPARAKRFTRIGLVSASTAALSGGAALFFSQQVRQAAPSSSVDGSGAQIQQKILIAQSLGVVSDALLGIAAITLPIGLISNQRAKSEWEKRPAVSLSASSVALTLEF